MKLIKMIGICVLVSSIVSCDKGTGGNGSIPAASNAVSHVDPVTLSGSIVDGPVIGGTLYVFAPSDVEAVLETAGEAEDHPAALAGASPVASMSRAQADGAGYVLELSADVAGEVLFLVFDSSGALDQVFGDEPFNMESAVAINANGGSQHVNITPHTTLIARQVYNSLNLATAGTDDLASAIDSAHDDVVSALGTDDMDEELIPAGVNIVASTDGELIESASTYLGLVVRNAAAATGLDREDVLMALAVDTADGQVNGVVPASLDIDEETTANASAIYNAIFSGELVLNLIGGSCETTAEVLSRACQFDVMDDLLEGRAFCQDTDDEEAFEECFADAMDERVEDEEECEDVLEARLSLCESLDDAVHEPGFGEDFAANFVDPRQIGVTVDPNPWFPLVAGNQWIYEGVSEDDEGQEVVETITLTVTDKVKLIDGILCLVVNDVVEEDGEVIENTDDWIAQDVDGNVWYCGEIAAEFETFEDDDPADPELVALDGSWKSGRDGAEAGILIHAEPEVGQIIRQEVLFGEAEDAVEVLSLEGTQTSPGGSCEGACLVTRDFTPLEPDVEENKYYVAGLGLIVEVNVEENERVELQSFTAGP